VAWEKGSANGDCDICGETYKTSQLKKQWNGLMACDGCWDTRHPGDLPPRGVGRERNRVKNLRPRGDLEFLLPGDVTENDL
jgi:hypothetical protein